MKEKINYKGNDFSMTGESPKERVFFADGEEVDFSLKKEIITLLEKTNKNQ